MTEQEQLESLTDIVGEIAVELCCDYPNIHAIDAWQQLWVIAESYRGLEMALEDHRKVNEVLRDRLGMSYDDMVSLWNEVVYSKEKKS